MRGTSSNTATTTIIITKNLESVHLWTHEGPNSTKVEGRRHGNVPEGGLGSERNGTRVMKERVQRRPTCRWCRSTWVTKGPNPWPMGSHRWSRKLEVAQRIDAEDGSRDRLFQEVSVLSVHV